MDLKLSEAQQQIFAGWRRPHQSGGSPAYLPQDGELDNDLMVPAGEIDLVQDITTDCSVVASLCASTSRASKGHGKVGILSLISFIYF